MKNKNVALSVIGIVVLAIVLHFVHLFNESSRALETTRPPEHGGGIPVFAGLILILAAVFAAGVIYFGPTIIARDRRHPNATSIFVLNIFLGWTLIGWVIALVWAYKRPEVVAPAAEHAIDGQPIYYRRCPFCAEEILAAAIKCKHCHSDLSAHPAEAPA